MSTYELDHYTFQPWFQFVSKRPQAMVRTANSGYGHRKLGKLIRNFGRSFRNGTMMNEKSINLKRKTTEAIGGLFHASLKGDDFETATNRRRLEEDD